MPVNQHKTPKDILETLIRLCQPLSMEVIFDVGSYRGLVTDRYLELYPDAQYYLFEPQPEFAKDLSTKYAGRTNIEVMDMALHNHDGAQSFNIGVFPPTSSLFGRNKSGKRYYHKDYEMIEEIEVSIGKLDTVCANKDVRHINLLKIDAQGGEYAILEGASDLLKRQAVDVIFTEFFVVPHYEGAPLLNEIWSLMRDNGYDLYDMSVAEYGENGQCRYGDAIFLGEAYRRNYL